MSAMMEPVRVSPFIKFCRWSMLIGGILYGSTRYQALSKKQTAIREEFERTRTEREAKDKLLKESNLKAEMKMLSEATGSNFG